jgi:hypothetical protein
MNEGTPSGSEYNKPIGWSAEGSHRGTLPVLPLYHDIQQLVIQSWHFCVVLLPYANGKFGIPCDMSLRSTTLLLAATLQILKNQKKPANIQNSQ